LQAEAHQAAREVTEQHGALAPLCDQRFQQRPRFTVAVQPGECGGQLTTCLGISWIKVVDATERRFRLMGSHSTPECGTEQRPDSGVTWREGGCGLKQFDGGGALSVLFQQHRACGQWNRVERVVDCGHLQPSQFRRFRARCLRGCPTMQGKLEVVRRQALRFGKGGLSHIGLGSLQQRMAERVPGFGVFGGQPAGLNQQSLRLSSRTARHHCGAKCNERFNTLWITFKRTPICVFSGGKLTIESQAFGQAQRWLIPSWPSLFKLLHGAAGSGALAGLVGGKCRYQGSHRVVRHVWLGAGHGCTPRTVSRPATGT